MTIRTHAIPSARLLLLLGACALALGGAATPASAHPARAAKPTISGRISAPGYVVVALGGNGKMVSSAASSFVLPAPAAQYTLQLLTTHGTYAGPVVVGGGAGKVIVGLTGPVKLGTIEVIASKGYAHLSAALKPSRLVRSNWAWAHAGVPIGNGRNLGLVISPTKGTGPAGPGGDSDRSGIANAFDIASGGNGIINSLAPAKLARAVSKSRIEFAAELQAQPPNPNGTPTTPPANGTPTTPPANGTPTTPPANGTPTTPPANGTPTTPPANGTPTTPPANGTPTTPPAGGGNGGGQGASQNPTAANPWMSQLFLPMDQTVNEDAAGVTQSDIDSALQANLNLKLLDVPAGSPVDLDCNGLSFCSTGGSGEAALEGQPANCANSSSTFYCTVAFPSGSADPSTGFGEIVGPNAATGLLGNDAGGGTEFSLYPNATSAQVGSGDVITEVVTNDGTTTETPTTLDFVFNTVPAIESYSDTAGDSQTVSYPDASGLGTANDPLKVAAGPNGDVVVTFTVWRPQRAGVPGAGEPAFMDIGHLWYALDHAAAPAPGSTTVGSTTAPQCPVSDYSNLSSTLSPGASTSTSGSTVPPSAGVIDSSADTPASPANTISFTVDVSQCLAAQGSSLPVGQPVEFDISANSQSSLDHANQTFWLQRTS